MASAVFCFSDCSLILFNSAFCIFNSALAGSSFGSASAASAGSALSPAIQRPCLVMPIGTISYFVRSSASITALADTSETSCSPDWPPNRTPMRILSAIGNAPRSDILLHKAALACGSMVLYVFCMLFSPGWAKTTYKIKSGF